VIAQIIWFGHTVAEISCPTKYFSDASSINFQRSLKYGIECLLTAFKFRLAKMQISTQNYFRGLNEQVSGQSFQDFFVDDKYINFKNHLYNYLLRKNAIEKVLRNEKRDTV
jgi:hypothetical protein